MATIGDVSSGMLYLEDFKLDLTTKQASRETYDFFGVCGFVGGIMGVLVPFVSIIVPPYSQISF